MKTDHDYIRIETQEQARNRVIELIRQVKAARASCDVFFPDDQERTIQHQTQAFQRWLMTYGQAIGTVVTLYQCGKLEDVAYRELQQLVMNTLAPTIVGVKQ